MHVCFNLHAYNMPHACLVPAESKGGIPVLRTGFTYYFEVCAGNQTWALSKSSKFSSQMSHLSNRGLEC